MALIPGVRLGAYEVISLLAVGGMGEVYKAKDTRLNRTVAIKVGQQDPSPGSGQAAIAYLVMQYLEDETLADRIGKGAPNRMARLKQ